MEGANKKKQNLWQKFWFLLWKDDSPKGWIFSLIVIFVFIKFIFFPGLSLVTGTTLPLVIVESCSMYHEGNLVSNFDEWFASHQSKYEKFDIERDTFAEFIFTRGFNKGDILFVLGTDAEKLKIGDVIIFHGSSSTPVIHRIINVKLDSSGKIFSTIGDNNNGQLAFEKNIKEEQIIGRAVGKVVPYLGWGKLIFFESRKAQNERGFCKGR